MLKTLASRIRLLVILLCLGFGVSILVAFSLLSGRQIEATAHHDVETTSAMLSAVITDRSKLVRTLTRVHASAPQVAGLLGTDKETVSAEVPKLIVRAQVDAMTITDQNGQILGEDGFNRPPADPRSFPGIDAASRGESWSGIVARNNSIYIADSEPIRVAQYVKGTITSYVRLGNVFAVDLRSNAPLDLAFTDRGQVTAGTLPLTTLDIPTGNAPWSLSIAGRSYSAAYTPIPGSEKADNLGIVVLRPLEDIVGPYRSFSFAFLCVLATVAAVALVAGSLFATGVARALDSVVKAAQKLQAGKWPEKLVVTRADEIGLLESTFNDMTDALHTSRERLESMLDVDPLTELDNHRRFKENLEQEAARTTASGQPLALLFLDVDYFSDFNAHYGLAAGDQKLRDIAALLRAVRPDFATVARYGGEEFAILLPGGTTQEAEDLYATIRRGLEGTTLSGGCAELSAAKGRSEGLVAAAELALQLAKQLGRDRVCEFGSVPGAGDDEPLMLFRTLQDGTYAAARALAAAVDAKDPYTKGHSDRVARFAADLAAFVGSDTHEVDLVMRCGTLHDVGKIGIPDAILQKRGPLDAEETRSMQSHATLGEFIVRKVAALTDLLPGIRHHHERYDGGGYPDGLRANDIPRVARFLAIADTYDAMTSDRPYRKGRDPQIALEEIEKNAGVQFDPEFAMAFVRMMREKMGVGC